MHEYFGVGPEIREEFTSIFSRFLRWLPKHCLSMPSRRSLEIWHLVIDNLIANEVSPLFAPLFFWEFLLLGYGLVFSHFVFLCDFSDVFKSLA